MVSVTAPQETVERLTVQDVRAAVFDRAGIVDRGYNTRQVDAFLERVAETIAVLDRTIDALNEEIHRIRRWRQQVGAPDHAVSPVHASSADRAGWTAQAGSPDQAGWAVQAGAPVEAGAPDHAVSPVEAGAPDQAGWTDQGGWPPDSARP